MVSDPHNRAAQKCQSSAPSFGGIRIPDSSGFPMVFQQGELVASLVTPCYPRFQVNFLT